MAFKRKKGLGDSNWIFKKNPYELPIWYINRIRYNLDAVEDVLEREDWLCREIEAKGSIGGFDNGHYAFGFCNKSIGWKSADEVLDKARRETDPNYWHPVLRVAKENHKARDSAMYRGHNFKFNYFELRLIESKGSAKLLVTVYERFLRD